MSSALIWQLVKNHNSFLVKRGKTNRSGAIQFSSERGNVLSVNSYKYSAVSGDSAVDVTSDLKLFTQVRIKELFFLWRIYLPIFLQNSKEANKPVRRIAFQQLSLNTGKSGKVVTEVGGSLRADLVRAARLKLNKVARAISIQKKYNKKVVKSSNRKSRR
jgi:hypothetical protein